MGHLAHSVGAIEEDDLPIDGEVLTEDDLVETTADLMDVALPDGVDQGWLMKALWDDLRRGEHAEAVLAEAEMARVIEMNKRLDTRMIDGMGQLVARVPMSVYMHWTARYGEDFWRQKDSIEFLTKRAGGGRGNPGFMVESTVKPQVVVDGFKKNSAGADDAAGGGLLGVKPADAVGASAVPAKRGPRGRRGRWAT